MGLDLELSTDCKKLLQEIAVYGEMMQESRDNIASEQRRIGLLLKKINRRKRALYELGWKG